MFTSNQEMGLGLMVVSKSGETFYANLWLPGRYCNHQSLPHKNNMNCKTAPVGAITTFRQVL